MARAYSNEIPTFAAGEALAADRLVQLSGGSLVYADSNDEPIGITANLAASGANVAITPINASGVVRVTASTSLSSGDAIYAANDGKVTPLAAGRRIGTALQAATADGQVIPAMINTFSGDELLISSGTIKFQEDFLTGSLEDGHKFSTSANKSDWLVTTVDGDSDGGESVNVADDAHGGILAIVSNDKANDAEQLQLNGESFKLQSGKQLYFETSFAVEDVSATDLFIGLAIADTTVLGGVSDRIGVQMLHDGNIKVLVEKDGTETLTDTGEDITDGTLATFATKSVKVSMLYDGDADEVLCFVDDVYAATLAAANIPDDEALTPTIAMLAVGAAAETVWVDYFNIAAER